MRSKKIIAVANGVLLVVTIVVSYLSSTGVFNGNTMASLSARYPTLVTPAPYAFGIWGLIYLALAGFVVYYWRMAFQAPEADDPALRVGGWFIVTCVVNCCWVLAWLYDQTGLSVFLMVVLLVSLMRIVVLTDMEISDPLWPVIVFVWWPFCYYAGWITVALLANIAAWLVKLEVTGFELIWAIGMILLAGAVYLWMTWKRNMREYAIVGVWALVAVAVADRHRETGVASIALIVAAILFVSSGLHSWKNRAYGPFRKR
jgi:hypothetical protein